MDILTLPVMGYFLLPSVASYSTSLNLLFFWMTWSTLVLTNSPLKVEVVSVLGIRALFFVLPSTLFLLFDSAIPSLAVGLKAQGAEALPTRARRVRKGTPPCYKIIGLSIFNVCMTAGIQAGIEYLLTEVFNVRSALKVTTTMPMPWSIGKDVLKGLLIREILQYYIHRFILHSASSNFFGRAHSRYFHSIASPYSFATHYDHPASYVLFRFLPIYLPAVIFRTHLLTYLLLLSIVSLEETLTLSGYTAIPGIILGGIARRQDLHSESQGMGNFAPLGFMDWIHGTSIGLDVIDDMRAEAEKHRVKERGSTALDHAKERGKSSLRSLGERTRKSRS